MAIPNKVMFFINIPKEIPVAYIKEQARIHVYRGAEIEDLDEKDSALRQRILGKLMDRTHTNGGKPRTDSEEEEAVLAASLLRARWRAGGGKSAEGDGDTVGRPRAPSLLKSMFNMPRNAPEGGEAGASDKPTGYFRRTSSDNFSSQADPPPPPPRPADGSGSGTPAWLPPDTELFQDLRIPPRTPHGHMRTDGSSTAQSDRPLMVLPGSIELEPVGINTQTPPSLMTSRGPSAASSGGQEEDEEDASMPARADSFVFTTTPLASQQQQHQQQQQQVEPKNVREASGHALHPVSAAASAAADLGSTTTAEVTRPPPSAVHGPEEILYEDVLRRVRNALYFFKIRNHMVVENLERTAYQITFCSKNLALTGQLFQRLNSLGVGSLFGSVHVLPVYDSFTAWGMPAVGDPLDNYNILEEEGKVNSGEKADEKKRHVEQETNLKLSMPVETRAVYEQIAAGAELNKELVLMTIVASLLAAVALAVNNTVVIVASMLVSPLMGPILGVTFGMVARTWRLVFSSLLNEAITLIICVIVGMLVGIPFSCYGNTLGWPNTEMASRGYVSGLIIGLGIAIPSGVGVAVSMLQRNASSLVGVAISASLLPPAVNTGMCWTYAIMGNWLDVGTVDSGEFFRIGIISMCLCLLNIGCILVFAYIVFRWAVKIRAPEKGSEWSSLFAHEGYDRGLPSGRVKPSVVARLMEQQNLIGSVHPDSHAAQAALTLRSPPKKSSRGPISADLFRQPTRHSTGEPSGSIEIAPSMSGHEGIFGGGGGAGPAGDRPTAEQSEALRNKARMIEENRDTWTRKRLMRESGQYLMGVESERALHRARNRRQTPSLY